MIQEDFEQHVVKLQNALLGFAKSLTHNEDEAKDLLQETSLKALSNKAMYDDSGSIKSWLYTIMRNLFLNCRRHSSRQESLPTDFEIPDTDDMKILFLQSMFNVLWICCLLIIVSFLVYTCKDIVMTK